jgi:tetratricopeptide (TPR) repeat protein
MRIRDGLSAFFLSFVVALASPAAPNAPINAQQLLAWVIGGMSTDHLTSEVRSRGISFKPESAHIELLKSAGASASLLDLLPHVVRHTGKLADIISPTSRDTTVCQKLELAANALSTKQYESARTSLLAAVQLQPNNADLLFALGGVFQEQGDWEHAAQADHQAVAMAPDFLDAHLSMAYACYRLDDADCADAESRLVLQRQPQDAEAHKDLGLANSIENNLQSAAQELREAIRLKPDYADAYYDLGNVLHEGNDLAGSAAAYQQAIRLNPDNWKIYYNLGLTLDGMGDHAGSITAYRKAKELDPGQLEVRQNLGAQLCETAQYEDSIKELRELLAMDPKWNMARGCLGKSLFFTGHVDEAIVEYRKDLQDDPSDEMARLGLGIALMDGKKQYGEAQAQFQQDEHYHPDSPFPHWDLGRLYFQQAQLEQSAGEIETALRFDPKNTKYLRLLAWDYEGLNRLESAQEILERIIALDTATSGAASLPVARAQAELAQVLGSQHKYDQAKPLYIRAIQTLSQDPKSKDDTLQTVLNNYHQMLRDESAHSAAGAKTGPPHASGVTN